MRIEAIELAWFRGAADTITLDPKCKSIVVYGENGSGKSSFVDAVEYLLNGGKIGHLAHEYSGKHQEKGIVNTHTPPGRKTGLKVRLKDGSEIKAAIARKGTSTISGAEHARMGSWDYRRTILRQDEVATFIRETKGGKYSALLPLLGLDHMENAAENLRQLAKTVERQSKLVETRNDLQRTEAKRRQIFGDATDDQIFKTIETLYLAYLGAKATTTEPLGRCKELETELISRINSSSADLRKHVILKNVADLSLSERVSDLRSANSKLAGAVEPLIVEKLDVLQSVTGFMEKLEGDEEVTCPACGRSIPTEAFQLHIKTEQKRLQELIAVFNSRKAAIENLCDALKSIRSNLTKADVKVWRETLDKGTLSENIKYLDRMDIEVLCTSSTEDCLKDIEVMFMPLIDAAKVETEQTTPDARQFSSDSKTVAAGRAAIEAVKMARSIGRAETLISFIYSIEQGIRQEIRARAQKTIDEISSDIQDMWEVLHPGEPVEDVRLYVPEESDKAIDIGLKFHGVEQDSPRLTLSEGYRNSLGLCIFLSMAKRDADKDRPLLLDDVVVSLDRNHRGMIVELLEKKFSSRQVIILTHDREWYTELRQQLDDAKWLFRALMPWESPEIGIRWSRKVSTFDDARAQLKGAPDSAGNTVRKIMDIELALRSERLKIRLPYLHREKNDHRTAHDFLLRIISDADKCFQRQGTTDYESHSEAIAAFRAADGLLLSWGNRASHTFDMVKNEAEKLINACEKCLEFFDCDKCGKPVYKFEDKGAELLQCQCGSLRWRYGKV